MEAVMNGSFDGGRVACKPVSVEQLLVLGVPEHVVMSLRAMSTVPKATFRDEGVPLPDCEVRHAR
ncbi:MULTISPECIES: hypothetical protein [Rhizobiaceae]|uniref:hypothetical protein n=1 Tax=Rhizobiaceae TaxID=82115 RepID=UPI0004AFFFBF|nr:MULTISPECIES: hypothetical protein [Rhizobiaceae]AWM24849.1 hypothetical protein AOX55_00001589 [Sinorhizobium fredii CCBAU 25509]KQY10893.1 hypothetical protein ASD36_09305 [Rhizobium sp. Root1334]KRC04877.1 hypothetical protein ASE23_07070 [Rhizobium sp. Root73]